MLSVVTHDLRTPVNTMMATLSILSDSMRERREEVRKWFDMAYRATEQMKSLIEDLLDTSRLEADQFTVDRTPGNAKAIIEEACEMLRPLAGDKGVSIDHAVPVGMPWLSVDVPQIVRVIGNLVGNAIKFSRRGGHIQVLASRHDQELRISVRDDGNGIPEDQLSMVFDRFWTDRSSDRRGIGLGLAIAKGIVEAHGGRIWVESQKDVGSTFTFSLPIGVDNIEPDIEPAPLPAGTAPAVSPSRTAE
jgi:signal transduction histidine kinase